MRDYVQDGVGHGPIGAAFNVTNRLAGGFDPGMLRPFIETDPNSPDVGRPCAQLRVGSVYNARTGKHQPRYEKRQIRHWQEMGINSPVWNATTLSRDDWIEIDAAIVRATRQPLSAWSDLLAANRRTFDAWGRMTLEYTARADSGEVVKSMDATDPGRADVGLSIIRSVPLPVIHGDWDFPKRLLDQNGGQPGGNLDTEQVEQVTRRGWEMVERTLIGTETGVTWGGRSTGPWPHTGNSTEYGYTNFPYRVTKTDLTTPTGTNPEAIVQDVMEMIETMNGNGYFGPFVLYHSTPYSIYLNSDYFRSGSTSAVRTVRERVMEIDGITDIRRLNYLTSGYQLVLVDLGTGQFQAIDGMRPTAVMWEERGGLLKKGLVMMIQVPFLRAPYNGTAALVHGTTS